MTRFLITITLIIILVIGGLTTITMFGKRDSQSRQIETFDTVTE